MVSLSDGCSGSDIANLTADALLEPIREMESALYWRRVSGEQIVLHVFGCTE